MDSETLDLAQRLYEAYVKFANGKSLITGAHLPPWHLLSNNVADAWVAVATTALEYTKEINENAAS